MPAKLSPETLAAQALGEVDRASGAVVPPIAEHLLAALEGGAACMLFASGSAAATAVFQSLLPGDHVIVSRILYWGVRKWLAEFGVAWGLDVEFADTTDLAAVAAAIRPGRTRLLWVETPANPTWDVTDLAAVTALAHAADVRVVADNTVATPVHTRPLALGADLVVHSATKYLNGHSDVLAGAIVTARPDPFWERIRAWRRTAGCLPGPFEAWLLQRGMRTLFVRVHRSSGTALELARHFRDHPALAAVLYPGLPSHPGHEIAVRQMSDGFGGMLSIRLAGGERAALAALAGVKVFKRATSLGGVESLIEHRRSTEGASSPVPADLLRLSIGLEAPDDLITDLEAALDVACCSSGRPGTAVAPLDHPIPDAPPPAASDPTAAVVAAVERCVAPVVVARGGAIRVVSVDAGVVTLEATGSPGAIVPATARIEALLRAAVPGVPRVHVAWPDAGPTVVPRPDGPAAGAEGMDEVSAGVRRVLDETVNPAVAAHRGHVTLVDAAGGRVRLRLDGGCQGCSLAEATLRQGIEPLLRRLVPGVVAVIDATDHAAATAPFFAPGKR